MTFVTTITLILLTVISGFQSSKFHRMLGDGCEDDYHSCMWYNPHKHNPYTYNMPNTNIEDIISRPQRQRFSKYRPRPIKFKTPPMKQASMSKYIDESIFDVSETYIPTPNIYPRML